MTWSRRSREKADETHPDVRKVAERVDQRWSSTVLDGGRTIEEQRENVRTRVSKTLESRHLATYSKEPDKGVDAIDVAPDPLRWPNLKKKLVQFNELLEAMARDGLTAEDRSAIADQVRQGLQEYGKELGRWYAFAGYFHGVADELFARGEISRPLRHGYDWDGDHQLDDQGFDDLPHHEARGRPL